MADISRADTMLCPRCGRCSPLDETPLLRIEAEWRGTGAIDSRRPDGWFVKAALAGDLQWACEYCLRDGSALEGRPSIQLWCDFNPYFAFIDADSRCEDCSRQFVFTAVEQRYWYETLKFWVQSRPKQCVECRRARRASRQKFRGEQERRRRSDC